MKLIVVQRLAIKNINTPGKNQNKSVIKILNPKNNDIIVNNTLMVSKMSYDIFSSID